MQIEFHHFLMTKALKKNLKENIEKSEKKKPNKFKIN